MNKPIRGYKVFNPDWTCKSFKYEIGKEYKMDIMPDVCSHDFHFCEIAADCFSYYSFDSNNHVALVESLGDISRASDDSKIATNHIRILEEITWEKLLTIVNTGKENSGNRNSGNWNSGDGNSGDGNSGNWNSGNWNSGFLNTIESKVNIFDTQTELLHSEYIKSDWYNILSSKPLPINTWIYFRDMSDEEKQQYQKAYVCDGYLKKLSYKEAWSTIVFTDAEKDILRTIPNWDANKFEQITGIKI